MKTRFALVLALLMVLAVVPMANAQGATGISYTSSFQLQNLSASTANVVLDYYNQDGTVAASKPYTIDANSNKTFVQLTDVNPGFNGSLVVSSDQDIRAINNLAASAGGAAYFESSNGFQAGTTTVNLPLIMCNNSGFNTWFNVQNAGSAAASVSVAYTPGSTGASGKTEGPFTIQPGAAKTFDQMSGSATMNCDQLKDATSGKFIGSAIVTSNQPVAVQVMEVGSTVFKAMMGYGGFGAGSATVVMPLIMGNNSNFYTSVQIMNTSSVSTQVTLAYGANSVSGGFNPQDEVFTLGAHESKTIFQNANSPANGSTVNNWAGQGKYIGSGKLTAAAAGATLVAIVNQNGKGLVGSGYSGVDPSTATGKISIPLLMGNNNSFYTSVQIMNTGSAATNVTLHYTPNTASGGTFNPADEVFTLQPNSSKTIFQNSGFPANGSTVNDWTGKGKYIGSGQVTATTAGGTIIAIVNQQSAFPGDQLATNNSFNY